MVSNLEEAVHVLLDYGRKMILSISLEIERSPFSLFRGYNCPKKVVQKLNEQICPFKYTKWFLSISSEMERIQNHYGRVGWVRRSS
jgi:hypothetical protein